MCRSSSSATQFRRAGYWSAGRSNTRSGHWSTGGRWSRGKVSTWAETVDSAAEGLANELVMKRLRSKDRRVVTGRYFKPKAILRQVSELHLHRRPYAAVHRVQRTAGLGAHARGGVA